RRSQTDRHRNPEVPFMAGGPGDDLPPRGDRRRLGDLFRPPPLGRTVAAGFWSPSYLAGKKVLPRRPLRALDRRRRLLRWHLPVLGLVRPDFRRRRRQWRRPRRERYRWCPSIRPERPIPGLWVRWLRRRR